MNREIIVNIYTAIVGGMGILGLFVSLLGVKQFGRDLSSNPEMLSNHIYLFLSGFIVVLFSIFFMLLPSFVTRMKTESK